MDLYSWLAVVCGLLIMHGLVGLFCFSLGKDVADPDRVRARARAAYFNGKGPRP